MSAPEPRPALPGAPTALVVAAALTVIVGGGFALMQTYVLTTAGDGPVASWASRSGWLAWRALGPAVTALAIAGFLDLARRSPPREAQLLQVGTGALGALLVLPFAMLYVESWATDRETLIAFSTWHARVHCAAAVVASACLVAAGWRHPTVRAAGVPLVIVAALVFPTAWLRELVDFTSRDERGLAPWGQLVVDRGLHLAFWGLLLVCAEAIGRAGPPQPGWNRAGAGLHRAGSALIARLLIAVASSVAIVVAVKTRSSSLLSLWVWLFPVAALIASAVLVAGLLAAGSLGAAGAPRVRLHLAAALVGWAATIQAFQAAAYVRALGTLAAGDEIQGLLPYLTPGLALAGLLCAMSAAFSLRSRLTVAVKSDEAAIITASVMAFVGALGTAQLHRWLWDGVRSMPAFYMLMVGLAIAAVIGQIAVARVLHRLGAAMQQVPELPVATVATR